jgi:hypothetical protein
MRLQMRGIKQIIRYNCLDCDFCDLFDFYDLQFSISLSRQDFPVRSFAKNR